MHYHNYVYIFCLLHSLGHPVLVRAAIGAGVSAAELHRKHEARWNLLNPLEAMKVTIQRYVVSNSVSLTHIVYHSDK